MMARGLSLAMLTPCKDDERNRPWHTCRVFEVPPTRGRDRKEAPMDNLDPHLTILLEDFVRLCPGDAPLEEEDWTGLYEICLFVHEQAIPCTPSSLREYLLEHGCSARKATYLGHQFGHFFHILTLRDRRNPSSAKPRAKRENVANEEAV